ncbi:MAG: M15 family metallopeptidase [Akkermansia sp.]|nr:M15 family metallopeptidase [Akkermansia sp.]MBR5185825.1 M15 family metallopeptidase [Akkermansia sp.]
MTLDELKKDVKFWQRLLKAAGYYKGRIDGIRGVLQEAAENKWIAEEYAAKQEHGVYDARTEINLSTLMPEAQKVARAFMKLATKKAAELGLVVKVICGTRSYAEQNALYNKKPRVTKAKGGYSWHNFGLAFDIGLFDDSGVYLGNSKHYKTLGKLADEVEGLEWGGNWKSFKDEPHFQLAKYGSTSEARNIFNNL